MTSNERLADVATVFNVTCKKFSLPNGETRLDIKYSLSDPEVGEVLIVDDVICGGTTLSTLHDLMSDDLLIAKAAIVLVGRADGQAELPDDIPLHTLLTYDPQTEQFAPNQFGTA